VYSSKRSVAEVFEIGSDAKIAAAHKSDDGLQIVFLFSGDANLSILQLALHFEVLRLDRLDDFLGFGAFETLVNFQFLSRLPERRNRGFDLFDVTKIDCTLGKLADDNFAQAPQPSAIFSSQRDFVFFVQNLGDHAFKVETRGEFFSRLVEGVINLLFIHFGDDVERRHAKDFARSILGQHSNDKTKIVQHDLAIGLHNSDASIDRMNFDIGRGRCADHRVDLRDFAIITLSLHAKVTGNFPVSSLCHQVK